MPQAERAAVDRPLVACAAGRALGAIEGELHVWRGLPYAHPPVGPRRFQPCTPLDRWEGVHDAATFGPASAQVYDPADAAWAELTDTPGPPGRWVGDEDSLSLNIWAPAAASGLPVLVFIHGGANWLEASRRPLYSGDTIARGGIIFVSFNYRLGVFGFLDLTAIGGPEGAHAHGLTDQAAALAWVARNIEAFGGDPDNVTLVGQSAGSMDAGWLLAAGLLPSGVRRLVLMSGVASVVGLGWDGERSAHAADEGRARAADLLQCMGFHDFGALAAASTDRILSAHAAAAGDILFDEDTRFYPRIGALASRDPFAAVRDGAARGIDVMIGFTAFEIGLWLGWNDDLDRRAPEWAAARMPHLPPAVRAEAPAFYRSELPGEEVTRLGMHLLSDAMFAMPAVWLADLAEAAGGRVWAYRYDRTADPRRGAQHAADLAMLFGHHANTVGAPLLGPARDADDAAAREALSTAMRRALIAFVRTGDPSTAVLPWPRYGPARTTMLWDDAPRVVSDPLRRRRQWWTAHALPGALGGGL